jgi:hypothetical protein
VLSPVFQGFPLLFRPKHLAITTAGGKTVELKDALEKMKSGTIVVAGRWMSLTSRVFRDDILVLSSPELIGTGTSTTATGGFGRDGGVLVQPAAKPRVLPAVPTNPPVPEDKKQD